MSVFKCKMCGGTIEFESGSTVGVCDSCGTKQTLPRIDSDRRENMYDRADHYRRNNDYDKAMIIYEQILSEDNTDAEAHWSVVLCRYGIEYVEDPASHKRIPTVNRTQFTSIFDDADFQATLQYADDYQREIYISEAKAIEQIQKDILDISKKEDPFDVFICYKETDTSGRRTQDSVIAYDLYQQLTKEGLKVFFSRVTLEDKLGTAYEPYIFAALNSAKVMVVVGTKPEYFNAVWVRNEWSRFLGLIKSDGTKVLIPAYRDMDPYDLPDEFSHLQAQDMSKLGFMQDLIRGILKICENRSRHREPEKSGVDPLFKRIEIFMEDGDWKSVDEYANRVLDIEPENTLGYLYKTLAKYQAKDYKALAQSEADLDNDTDFDKACRFADQKTGAELEKLRIVAREYRVSKILERAEAFEKEDTIESLREAKKLYFQLEDDKDAREKALACEKRLRSLEKKSISKRKRKRFAIALSACIVFVLGLGTAGYFLYQNVLLPKQTYRQAMELQENGDYDKAVQVFQSLGDYEDSKEQINKTLYRKAETLSDRGNLKEAISVLDTLGSYEDSAGKKQELLYRMAEQKMEEDEFEQALEIFENLKDYSDAKERILECKYDIADALFCDGQYLEAADAFTALKDYSDASDRVLESKFTWAKYNFNIRSNYSQVCEILLELGDYPDAKEILSQVLSTWMDLILVNNIQSYYNAFLKLDVTNEELQKMIYDIVYEKIQLQVFERHNWTDSENNTVTSYYPDVFATKYVSGILGVLPKNYEYTEPLIKLMDILAKSNNNNEFDEIFYNNAIGEKLYELDFFKSIFENGDLNEGFYLGNWKTTDGKTYFKFTRHDDRSMWIEYNIPVTKPSSAKYWNLIRNPCKIIWENENSEKVGDVCQIKFINYNTMNMYCYKNNVTYTLTRSFS